MNKANAGDVGSFSENWRNSREAYYLHWTRNKPENQIQLAFRNHWLTFQELIGPNFIGNRVLEVGCGRGSLSAYFSDAGWNCTLLDLSPEAIVLARSAFASNGLKADFDIGDCLAMPYSDDSFDLVFSIGLLEHFEDVAAVIEEQIRVLAPGGLFIGYVVPEIQDNVQSEYKWFCQVLKSCVPKQEFTIKRPVYRSDLLSHRYIEIMNQLGLESINSSGIYPLPMLSYSIDFPFTLLPPEAERIVVEKFVSMLEDRRKETKGNPWLCDEKFGQAFIVWGRKKLQNR